jgi:hypothetical protein
MLVAKQFVVLLLFAALILCRQQKRESVIEDAH